MIESMKQWNFELNFDWNFDEYLIFIDTTKVGLNGFTGWIDDIDVNFSV